MIRARLAFAWLLGAGLAWCQAPPKVFELEIAEFRNQTFDSDVIELPLSRLRTLTIHLLNPVADNIAYGRIYPKLNGDAARVICQVRGTARGKAVVMDLTMRPDLRLREGANALEITAVNQRGRKYYKNWILRTREHARNEWFSYDYSLSPADENAAPPDLVLYEPEIPLVFEPGESTRRVKIRGSASAIQPLASVAVNGVPVKAGISGDAVEFDLQLTASRRDPHVIVEAVDQKGNRTRVTVPVVTVSQAAPVKLAGERWALVVGVSRYGGGKDGPPPALAAAADAGSFASMLVARAGFRNDRVLTLLDDKAQAAQIRNAFRNFVAQAQPDDVLLVYFAGRGLHDPVDPEKIYLAAYDTRLSQLADTALEVQSLEELLTGNVRSRNTLLLFDVGRELGANLSAGNNLVNGRLLKLFSKEKGRAVMVSGSVNEVTREREKQGRYEGLFTSWLIDALVGQADWNHDRIVTAAEFFRYVSDKVRAETGGGQVPRYQLAAESLPLAGVGN